MMAELFDENLLRKEDDIASREEARNEGIAEGRYEEKKETTINMLNLNLSDETISQCTGLSYEEIASLKKTQLINSKALTGGGKVMQYIVDEPIEGYDILATIRESKLRAERKGERKAKKKAALNMLKYNISDDIILECTGISAKTLESLKKKLN